MTGCAPTHRRRLYREHLPVRAPAAGV